MTFYFPAISISSIFIINFQEADKLEQAADDPHKYYVIEKDPIICKYISVPKGKISVEISF